MAQRDDTRRDEPLLTGASDRREPSPDDSKDAYFERVATLANEMIAHHGTEFTMGTLVLAAKFIAEGKNLSKIGDDG